MAGVPASSRGATAPGEGGVYLLSATAVAPDTSTLLSWAFSYGTAQVSLAAPTAPLPLVAGVYSLGGVLFVPAGMVAGKLIWASLEIDADNNDAQISIGGTTVTAGGSPALQPNGASITFYTAANSPFASRVTHQDVAARDVDIRAYVQRVA